MPDNDLLTPERLEEIRARMAAVRSAPWQFAEKAGEALELRGPDAMDDLDSLLAHIAALTAQRDHYHTEWTARGTALWQREQDIDALKAKAAFTPDDVRVLEMAEYRYGFCPRTESCGGCDRCNADWDLFLAIRPRLAALTLITPTP